MNFIQNIDDYILVFIQDNIINPVLDSIMPVITSLGNGGTIWLVIAIILVCSSKYRKYGIMMLVSLLLCLLVGNLGLKLIVKRLRPCHVNLHVPILIDRPLDFSFPSGHTMTSFAAATILMYMNKKIGIIGMIGASLIAFSRLYLYVHYPSDVLVGMIIGIILSVTVVEIYKRKIQRSNDNLFGVN
ncbi:MAG: phosphatase PAP2 family protein [Clostridium perfringens]|nr:phosphatase PAP2 family protein [Clostridium perfringens]